MSFSRDVKTECKNKSFTSKRRNSRISNGSFLNAQEEVRNAFLANGFLSDPEKNYLLEFVYPAEEEAKKISDILMELGISSKLTERKGSFVTYVQDADAISDVLTMMGAHKSLMVFENARILKEMRGNVQRKVNCETANLMKTVTASVRQTDDIEYIEENLGFDKLPDGLREMAEQRLKMPDATLSELAKSFSPELGKSCVNHRLRKLSQIANQLRKNSEECQET